MASVGEIYLHNQYYRHAVTQAWLPKYLLILAIHPSGDIVFRLLTSQPHGRPHNPPCYHGDPVAGYYLGILGGALNKPTWVDFTQRDIDDYDFGQKVSNRVINLYRTLQANTLCHVLSCAANAPDTTIAQFHSMQNARHALGCPP